MTSKPHFNSDFFHPSQLLIQQKKLCWVCGTIDILWTIQIVAYSYTLQMWIGVKFYYQYYWCCSYHPLIMPIGYPFSLRHWDSFARNKKGGGSASNPFGLDKYSMHKCSWCLPCHENVHRRHSDRNRSRHCIRIPLSTFLPIIAASTHPICETIWNFWAKYT